MAHVFVGRLKAFCEPRAQVYIGRLNWLSKMASSENIPEGGLFGYRSRDKF